MSAEIHDRKRIHTGRVFTLVTETVTLSNGTRVDLDVIEHPGATAIVPFIDADHILMLQQYRHAVRTNLWEIPAGTLDPEESELACAGRELIEETGYRAEKWRKMGEIIPVPGYSNERIHMYLAEELTLEEQNLDADEVIEVHRIAFEDALAMVRRGEIVDAKTISGLHMADRCLKR